MRFHLRGLRGDCGTALRLGSGWLGSGRRDGLRLRNERGVGGVGIVREGNDRVGVDASLVKSSEHQDDA